MSQSMKKLTDEELCVMLRGDREDARRAFDEIYERYAGRVFTYCRKILADGLTAEDMLQEAFTRFYENATDGRIISNIEAYVLRIARNLCLNEKGKRMRYVNSFEECRFPTEDAAYESAELLKLIEMALAMIPEDYREAYVLREFLGLSYNEIAEITGVSLSIVKTRLYRSKSQIRDILAPYIADLHK